MKKTLIAVLAASAMIMANGAFSANDNMTGQGEGIHTSIIQQLVGHDPGSQIVTFDQMQIPDVGVQAFSLSNRDMAVIFATGADEDTLSANIGPGSCGKETTCLFISFSINYQPLPLPN